MIIRQATLDDTRRIVKLFIGRIPLWQRMGDDGRVEDLPYDSLSIYERWLHGGACMSLETASIWLNHLLGGAGLAWVAEADGEIVAYAEAYINDELAPMGKHLHVSRAQVDEAAAADAHLALAEAILDDAREVGKLSVAYPEYDRALSGYYGARFGVKETFRLTRYALPAELGKSFYKSQEYDRTSASLIDGWAMPIGRLGSPRETWESEWQPLWQGVPQILARGKRRFYINAAGHEALLCFHQRLYTTRTADVYCFSPRHMSPPLLVAIRDLGHKLGFRSLNLALNDSAAKLLPAEAVADPHQQIIATVDV